MATITIPKNLMSENDLMVVPRLKYERMLAYLKLVGEDENLWKSAAKAKFFNSYSKSDEIYDQI